MSTQYVVAKYIDDLARNEPVNVGIIVFDSERAVARFVGEREPGSPIDLRRLGKRINAGRTFRSWVDYWRRGISDPGVDTSKAVTQLMEESEGNFVLAPGGTVLMDATGEPLEEMLNFLYGRIVESKTVEGAETFETRTRRRPINDRSLSVLRRAGAPLDDPRRFRRNVGVRVTIAGVEDEEEVSYAVMNGAWHYLQEVVFDPDDARSTRRDAHHAALLVQAAKLGRKAVFLYERDRVATSTEHLIEMLEAVAPAIDIADEEQAADQLRTQLRLT